MRRVTYGGGCSNLTNLDGWTYKDGLMPIDIASALIHLLKAFQQLVTKSERSSDL